MNKRILILYAAGLALTACAKTHTVTVTNDTDLERLDEIVTLPASVTAEGSFIIADADGKEVTYQILADGSVIFPATVDAGSTAVYTIKKGTPAPTDTLLAWTQRPDCQDDFAWENEHSGYRLYGPLFKRKYGNVHGYDIWCKRGSTPVVERFYDLDKGPDHISYHKDHGEGFDGYTVGATLGAGMAALVDSTGAVCYPTAYDKYEVIDYGPLRLTVRFEIDSIPYQGGYVKEIRTLSLDRGSYFNKVATRYEGLDSAAAIVAGVVVHRDNPNGYRIISDGKAISVTDLTDAPADNNGEIYIGVIMPSASQSYFAPFEKVRANAVGEARMQSTLSPEAEFEYYWGSGWSKGSAATEAEFDGILAKSQKALSQPLKVEVK